jgi:hypothetical protein
MPNNLQVLIIRELVDSGVIIVVAAAVVITVVDGVVADGFHSLGGGVTVVRVSVLLKQFPVLRVQGEWFVVSRLRHWLWLVVICRGLVPWVPWVTDYGPKIWIRLVSYSSKWLGNHTSCTGYGLTTPA